MKETIFISMPACNEDFIDLTVKSALNSAKNPENIYFGIFEQRTDNKPFVKIKSNKIRKISVKSDIPLGVGIARSNAMALLRKEKYTLAIDSHTLFPKNWDEKILNKYSEIVNKIGNNVLISQHLYSAKIEEGEIKISDESIFPSPPSMKIKNNMTYADSPRQEEWSEGFIENGSLTCHFIFGYSKIFNEVVFDNRIFYDFEEPLYSLRLCTRGYRLVSVDYNPMYHLDKGDYELGESPNIHEWKKMINYDVNEKYKISQNIAREVFLGKYFGYWGAPNQEALENYLKKFNISTQNSRKELCISNA